MPARDQLRQWLDCSGLDSSDRHELAALFFHVMDDDDRRRLVAMINALCEPIPVPMDPPDPQEADLEMTLTHDIIPEE